MISQFRLYQNENLLIDREVGFNNFKSNDLMEVSEDITINSFNRSMVPFAMALTSTEMVEILIKCFKSPPQPPKYEPCPEAGVIHLPKYLPKNGTLKFDLPSPTNVNFGNPLVNSFNLILKDYHSFLNLFIHIRT